MTQVRERHLEIASTQDRALDLARGGAEEGTVVVSVRQSSGRGRLDHHWASPEGGLYLSIVLESPAASAGLLPLGLGAALAEALEERCPLRLRVKWPNDVLVLGEDGRARKLAGILVDRVSSPRYGFVAVAGIGVNVATDRSAFPADLRDGVAVLAELCASPPTPDEVEPLVVAAAQRVARAIRDPSRVAAVRALCRQRLYGVGRPARLDGRPVGTIVTMGDEGELWVEQDGERMALRAGDLRVEEGP